MLERFRELMEQTTIGEEGAPLWASYRASLTQLLVNRRMQHLHGDPQSQRGVKVPERSQSHEVHVQLTPPHPVFRATTSSVPSALGDSRRPPSRGKSTTAMANTPEQLRGFRARRAARRRRSPTPRSSSSPRRAGGTRCSRSASSLRSSSRRGRTRTRTLRRDLEPSLVATRTRTARRRRASFAHRNASSSSHYYHHLFLDLADPLHTFRRVLAAIESENDGEDGSATPPPPNATRSGSPEKRQKLQDLAEARARSKQR